MNLIHRRQYIDEPASDPKPGRPRLYDEEQRAQRHRERALAWYHANKYAGKRAGCFFAEQGDADRKALAEKNFAENTMCDNEQTSDKTY